MRSTKSAILMTHTGFSCFDLEVVHTFLTGETKGFIAAPMFLLFFSFVSVINLIRDDACQ